MEPQINADKRGSGLQRNKTRAPGSSVAVLLLFLLGCDSGVSAEAAKAELIGKYELVVGTNQTVSRTDFVASSLTLAKNGSFLQLCVFNNGPTESITGAWTYSDKRIQFSSFKDCAGVWPASWATKETGASLIVEFTTPPTILLEPDASVYYQRQV